MSQDIYFDIEPVEAIRRMKQTSLIFGRHDTDQTGVTGTSDTALLADYVKGLQDKERQRRFWTGYSPQINYRKELISLLLKIGHAEVYRKETVYLAIYLLDYYMDLNDISVSQLPVMAMVCVCMAGKVIELLDRKLKYAWLSEYIDDPDCAQASMVSLELKVLRAFDYKIVVPTEFNFLEIFLMYAVDGMTANEKAVPNILINIYNRPNTDSMEEEVFEEDSDPCGIGKLASIRETAFRILEEFALIGPQNTYPVSLVAASITLIARREQGLNFWTQNLETVTGYSLDKIQDCLTNYMEPRVDKTRLSRPFTPPHLCVNYVLDPYIENMNLVCQRLQDLHL